MHGEYNFGSYECAFGPISECSPAGFPHLKTLRLDSLHEIVINSAFKRLVARLDELEVTELAVLLPQVPSPHADDS